MVELPNPFEDLSSAEAIATSSSAPDDTVAEPFPRGFNPRRFLAEIESPSTTPVLDSRFADASEVETMIIEALVGLSSRP
jgi:hypothetical protein